MKVDRLLPPVIPPGIVTSMASMRKPEELATTAGGERERWRLTYIYELIDSEDDFVQSLQKAEQDLLKPLRVKRNPPKEIERFYSCWQEIYRASSSLLSSLRTSEKEARIEPNKWMIGEVLIKELPKVEAWLGYSHLQKDLLSSFKDAFATWHIKSPSLKPDNQQRLDNYLSRPHERALEYPDLIEKILQHTAPDHGDYKDLQDAHAKALQKCSQISVSLELMKNIDELKHLESIVTFPSQSKKFPIVSATSCLGPRRLIHTGPLHQIKGGKESPCVAFLMNDCLLLTQPPKSVPCLSPEYYMDTGTKTHFLALLPVMFLHKVDVMKRSVWDPAVFNLLHVKQSEMTGFKLKATNPSDRDTWVLKIEEASRAYVQARRELYQPKNLREAEASTRLYVAKYRFSTDDPQALTFIPGDVIQVAETQEGLTRGWSFGTSSGQSGWFPRDYVTLWQDNDSNSAKRQTMPCTLQPTFEDIPRVAPRNLRRARSMDNLDRT